MGEGGLSPAEVGKEIAEHKHHHEGTAENRHDRIVTIIEASLLAIVALLAAWSGYSSSKWSTESRIDLAEASTARTEASRANLEAMELRNLDYSAFNAWFGAWVAGDEEAQAIAVRRFRPELKVAFDAWIAEDPGTNPDAAPGPTFMPQYTQPEVEHSQGTRRARRREVRGGIRGRRNRGQVRPQRRSTSRPCCSSWASADTSACGSRGTDSSGSA